MDEAGAADRFLLYREVVTERFYAPRLPPPPQPYPRIDEVVDLSWLRAELAAIPHRRAVLMEGDDKTWQRERDSMGTFTSKPANDNRNNDNDESTETRAQKVFRRAGKVASDHNERVNNPDTWPNHDKRGRGSR